MTNEHDEPIQFLLTAKSMHEVKQVMMFSRDTGIAVDMLADADAPARPKAIVLGEHAPASPDPDEPNPALYRAARALLQDTPMRRSELVRAVAKKTKAEPRFVGARIKKWLGNGVLELVDEESSAVLDQ